MFRSMVFFVFRIIIKSTHTQVGWLLNKTIIIVRAHFDILKDARLILALASLALALAGHSMSCVGRWKNHRGRCFLQSSSLRLVSVYISLLPFRSSSTSDGLVDWSRRRLIRCSKPVHPHEL